MTPPKTWLTIFGVLAAVAAGINTGCSERPLATPQPAQPMSQPEKANLDPASGRVREPAVAGLFYPKDERTLSRTIEQFLAAASPPEVTNLKALICPHAGYDYSGPTAAVGYKTLVGRKFKDVLLLAPSHYAAFNGASVAQAGRYRTPLGTVEISEKAAKLAASKPFVWEPRCRVQRPSWSHQSSRSAPPAGEDTPETWEHSGEVQVPFLQKTLKEFRLISVVCGEVDAADAARAVTPLLDEDTLLVASSDLSHYHPYHLAKELDTRCVKAICDLDLRRLADQEACGKTPILIALHLARQNGWKAKLLDYRNSGDTAGDKSGVVGYAAIALYAPTAGGLGLEERRALLDLARQSVKAAVTKGSPPRVETASLSPKLTEKKACFVTLNKNGALRGCIGHLAAQEPLYKAVMENAVNAAIHDYRFSPVQEAEVAQLDIEISVLTEPQPLRYQSPEELLAKLRPHKDGVILAIGPNRATYLPQVWEKVPDKVEFMDSLAQKAGREAAAWRSPAAMVSVYQVEAFSEAELGIGKGKK